MAELPEPVLVDKLDPSIVLAECVALFEAASSRALEPAQVERLIIDLIAYRESLIRRQIQDAAKQNLWRFSRYPMIDYLAEIVGAARLDALKAAGLFVCTIPVQPGDYTVPEGTQLRSNDGKAVFALDVDVVIPAGETTSDPVNGTCTVAGVVGNGYVAGQVTELVATPDIALTIGNTTTTGGGSPQESTERMRSRVPGAVKAFSTAGPNGAYVFYALSAHPDVLDVAVSTPEAGVVRVTLLIAEGADEEAVTDAVEAALDPEDVLPATDTVELAVAEPVDYSAVAAFVLKKGAKWSELEPLIDAAWDAYQIERRITLGAAPVISQIYAALSVLGVHQVNLSSPGVLTVDADEWARCTSTNFTFAGFEP